MLSGSRAILSEIEGAAVRVSSKTIQFQIDDLLFFDLDAQRLQELQVLIVDL
jgi:hypothetical protein